MQMVEKEEQKDEIKWGRIIAALLVVLVLWGANYYVGIWFWKETDRGLNGDMFGAVNALFSGFAFAGLIYAVLMQRDELKIAKQDMALTKKMLNEQSDHLKDQNLHSDLQMFETTFFQMLRLLMDVTEQNKIQEPMGRNAIEISGKQIFSHILVSFQNAIQSAKQRDATKSDQILLNECYEPFFKNNQNKLGHYFRFLYHLMRFVDEKCPKNPEFYSKIIRAHLSYAELELLLYNAESAYGREKMKPLIEKYSLLKPLPKEKLILSGIIALYDENAFGTGDD